MIEKIFNNIILVTYANNFEQNCDIFDRTSYRYIYVINNIYNADIKFCCTSGGKSNINDVIMLLTY